MREQARDSALLEALGTDVAPTAVSDMIGVQVVDIEDQRAAVVTLARPQQHNALTLAGWQRIAAAFAELAEDAHLRVVIVRGAGDRAFGAGADISEFPEQRLGVEAASSYNASIAAAINAVQSIPVPVIAMITGLAVGGGCELAAACDVRIASNDSRFGIPIGRLGVTLGLTETRAVVDVIGAANLKYLVYSGQLVNAEQAFAWGLVQQVVEREDLVDAAVRLAMSIASSSEITMRATKLVTARACDPAFAEDDPLLSQLHAEAYGGANLREGVDAFLNSRTPNFTSGRSAARGRA